MKKTLYVLLSVLLLLSACKYNEQADYAILLDDLTNPYWKTAYDGFKETADVLKTSVYIQSLTPNSTTETQLNQCENALLQNPKALIFSAINNVNLIPCLKKAAEKNIALVSFDSKLDEQIQKDAHIHVAFTIGSNNYELGKKAAEFLKDKTGQVLIIEGLLGKTSSLERVQGFTENLPPQIQVIASLAGNWDRLKAADITNDILMRYPDLSFIFAANDVMALGAAEAVRTKGKTNIKIIGVDGTDDAIKAIKEDRLTASIAQLPYLMAKEALSKTKELVENKQSFDVNQFVPVLTLNKEVLVENKEPLLQYVR